MNKNFSRTAVGVSLLTLLGVAGCSHAPKNDRERFAKHWSERGDKVSVLEVRQDGELVHGSGIVDAHPVDEFYNPKTDQYTASGPVVGDIIHDDSPRQDYASLLGDLAKEASKSLAESDRIAVLDFPNEKGKITPLSHDVNEKIEAALVEAGHAVVDRAKIDKVMAEHQFQQGDGALFDVSTLARLGKFVGANTVIYGKYLMLGERQLTVSAKVISVETTRVVGSKSKDIPLTGDGQQNRDWILNLLKAD